MFWKKKVEPKPMNSEEYEKLLKKIAEVNNDVEKISAKCKALETNYDLLRGQFNRKLAGIRKEEAKSEDIPDTDSPPIQDSKDLNTYIPIGIGNGKILQP